MALDIEAIIPYFLFAVGLIFIYLFIKSTQEAIASKTWPNTGGVITRSIVETEQITFGDGADKPSSRRPKIDIEYEYTVDGKVFRSTRLKIGGTTTATETIGSRGVKFSSSETGGLEYKYKLGTEVDVYYNPSNPKRSVLMTGGSQWAIGLVGIAAIAAGIIFFFL